ncbi:MAG TPA: hypothetical protein VNT51_01265, partial [Miltoncostaeaceae bacterium]|nr:hypothetical protein [Miltoncostaeaceae bacterium]
VREAALEAQRGMRRGLRAAAPHVDALVATPAGRARATAAIARAGAAIPADLVAHLVVGAARCPAAEDMEAAAAEADWSLDPAAITCPLRIVWGTGDVLLPWPAAAAAHRRRFPDADWVELDDVGHCPQLDAPLVTAELILGVTRG